MSNESESVRGLGEFGIPAPLLHAVGGRLKQSGIDVWVKGGLLEEWILLADAEALYSWVRKSKVTRVNVRVAGPQESLVFREFCTLLELGDPSIVLRAGFVEVKWTSSPEFFLAHVESDRPGVIWNDVFWRICEGQAGNRTCTWGECRDRYHKVTVLTKAARCSAFCPDEVIALRAREDLNARTVEASREVTITNKYLHSPHVARWIKVAERFESDIIVAGKRESSDPQWLNGKNTMSMFIGTGELHPIQDTQLVIRARGRDAERAVDHLASLVARKFDLDDDL